MKESHQNYIHEDWKGLKHVGLGLSIFFHLLNELYMSWNQKLVMDVKVLLSLFHIEDSHNRMIII